MLAAAKDRSVLTALDLAKLKAFFDRDAAIVWPATATTERAEAGRVRWVTESSRVTCHSPPLICSTTGPPPATTASRADDTLWYPRYLRLPPNSSDRTSSPSSTRRLSCPGVGHLPRYGLRRTWSASCPRRRPSKPTSRNPSVSFTCLL